MQTQAQTNRLNAVLVNIGEGAAATKATLRAMRAFALQFAKNPLIRSQALQIVQGLPPRDYYREAVALHNFVRDRIRFVRDVYDVETLQTPLLTLQHAQGDCDDKSTLLAALALSIGFPVRFVAVGDKPGHYVHVYLEIYLGGRWYTSDTTEPVALGVLPRKLPYSLRLDVVSGVFSKGLGIAIGETNPSGPRGPVKKITIHRTQVVKKGAKAKALQAAAADHGGRSTVARVVPGHKIASTIHREGDVSITKPGAILHDPLVADGLASPYNQAAANAVRKYGKAWQWMAYDNLYTKGGYVSISKAAIATLTKNITDLNARKWFFGALLPGHHKAVDIFKGLDGLLLNVAPHAYSLVGKQQPLNGDPVPTPGALIGALATGRLYINKAGAARIIAYSRQHDLVKPSAWQLWGQLLVTAAALIAGGELLGSGSAGGSGSAAASGGGATAIAPTTVSTAVPTATVTATPIAVSAEAIPAGVAPLTAAGGAVSAGSVASAAGAASKVANVASTASKVSEVVNDASKVAGAALAVKSAQAQIAAQQQQEQQAPADNQLPAPASDNANATATTAPQNKKTSWGKIALGSLLLGGLAYLAT